MIFLALTLITVALADVLIDDRAASGKHTARWLFTAGGLAVVTAGLIYSAYRSWTISVLSFVVLGVGVLAWTGLRRRPGDWSRRLAITALALMVALGGLVLPLFPASEAWESSRAHAFLVAYLEQLPWTQLAGSAPERVLLTLGMLLFLGPTSNAMVKTMLELIREGEFAEPEKQLKGGRYIGPLERWLIFGMAVAGQPTAAALVVSAKGIIRFPELQSKAAHPPSPGDHASPEGHSHAHRRVQGIDELTEYFLIGSLLSWTLALLAALPITAAGGVL